MRSLLVMLAACGAAAPPFAKPTLGVIAGLARDSKSGEVVPMAEIVVGGRTTKSDVNGMYDVDRLAPGRYTLVGRFAGQPVTIKNIDVSAGQATFVDVSFTLGDPSPIVIDFGDPRDGEIQRFTTRTPRIEGVVADASTRSRIAGAVVTAARGLEDETLQTVTDEHGRYRFDSIDLGTYAVSAYYSIGGRGQIEVRRADITVAAGEGVVVPLWIELAKQ